MKRAKLIYEAEKSLPFAVNCTTAASGSRVAHQVAFSSLVFPSCVFYTNSSNSLWLHFSKRAEISDRDI